jgi:hypothetical protein
VAQAFHASAVLLDCLRQFTPLTKSSADVQKLAHTRSQQLSGQLARALNCPPCVPVEWCPLPDALLAPPKSPPPVAPNPASRSPPLSSLPSVPTGRTTTPTALDGAQPSITRSDGPAGTAPAAGSAPQTPNALAASFVVGDEAWYFEPSSGWHPTRIAAVHNHDGIPYYTILHPLAQGNERETELDRLQPRRPRQPPPPIPPMDPTHPTHPAAASAWGPPAHMRVPPHAPPPHAPQAGPSAPPAASPYAGGRPASAGYSPAPSPSSTHHQQPSAPLAPPDHSQPPFLPPPAFVPRPTGPAQDTDGSASLLARLRVGERPTGGGAPAAAPPQHTAGGPSSPAGGLQYQPKPPRQHYAPQQPAHEAAAGERQLGGPEPTWSPYHSPNRSSNGTGGATPNNVTPGYGGYGAPPATAGHRTSHSSSADSLMKSLLQ